MEAFSGTTLREAAASHLDAAGLPVDGGRDERWVRAKLGPIPIVYPNTAGRKRALLAHDLHHLLAGYGTDLIGEGEMGAWELGSGLKERSGVRYAVRVFGFGLPWWPGRMRRAFMRGRRCRNLYERPLDDAFLEQRVGEVQATLGLTTTPGEPDDEDRRAFRSWAAKGVAIVWGPLVPIAGLAWWWLR